jgi:hypothetical protein
MNNELENIWKAASVAKFKEAIYPGIFLDRVRKSMESLS